MNLIEFPKQDTRFIIPGAIGHLEVMTSYPAQTTRHVVVICHPHPLFQGTMDNKVVTTLAKSFDSLGLATLRFNFRGVGKSEGQPSSERAATISAQQNYDSSGEVEDLRAVLRWLAQALPNYKFWLAGFSFGSYIAAKLAEEWPTEQLVSIAPPVGRMDFAHLTHIRCPWLVVQGEDDEVVSPAEVFAWAAQPPSPLQLIRMPEVGHFFHGKLLELKEELLKALPRPNRQLDKDENHSHLA